MKATRLLHNLGQSIWLDNITCDLLGGGMLKGYIDELSVRSLTSNPTIFDHAIKSSANPISFQDTSGIQYRFPIKDVASLVLSRPALAVPVDATGSAKVIPQGTPITIRADETIGSARSTPGQLYAAMVTQDVPDGAGGVAIVDGAQAKLLVRDINSGGASHGPELVLDLFSVSDHGKEYCVVTTDVDVSNRKGVGANRRTAEYAAGGSGALFDAIIGGGKGAGIGAGAGAAGGLLTQIFTRGKAVKLPAESVNDVSPRPDPCAAPKTMTPNTSGIVATQQ